MKFKFWPYFLLLLVSNVCWANINNRKPDSLRNELLKLIANKKQVNDTAIINDLNKLAIAYSSSYPDSTIYYGQMAVDKARKINYNIGIADGLLAAATTFVSQAKYENAIKNIDEAKVLYLKEHNLMGQSNCYKTYGVLYNQTSSYEKALLYNNKALAIKLIIKDLPGISRVYLTMGNIYDNQGNSSAALDYYFKALNIDTKLHNKKSISADYNNIGVILQNMEIYPKALEYFNKGLKVWRQMHAYGGIAVATQNIGEVLIAQGKYDEAIKYLNEALAINKKQDDKDGISSGYNDLGLCYIYKKENSKALNYLHLSLNIAEVNQIDYDKAITLSNIALYYNINLDYARAYTYALQAKSLSDHLGSILLRTNASIQWIKALGGLKLYKEAFFAQKEFEKMKSGFKKDESVQKFTLYTSEYNYADKQRQQAIQQKASAMLYQQKIHDQRLLNTMFFLIIAAMVIIVSVYYRQKHKQLQINKQLITKNGEVSEQKLNLDEQAEKLNELNKLKDRLIAILAHDLRSPLSTLRGLFSLLEDETISHQELLKMIPNVLKQLEYTSDFLDTLLFWINSQMDNFNCAGKNFLIKEVINAELMNYKEQAAAKGIDLIDEVNEDLMALADPNSVRIVLRNIVTNAIKFSGRGDTIQVSMVEQQNDIMVCIKDTGTGMSPGQLNKLFKNKVDSKIGTQNESGTGMGLLFCKDLVEKCNGTIWAMSEEGAGTKFCFTIPSFKVKNQEIDLVTY